MILIKANEGESEIRVDKFLCKKFDISFSKAQKLVREKKLKVNNSRVDAAYKIKSGDEVKIFSDLKERQEGEVKKVVISDKKFQDFLGTIIYRDENIVAINKPSGLATQGGSGIKICVDDFLPRLSKGAKLVHRLDKDTSGILLIALNKNSSEILTQAFKDKAIRKTYIALVCGKMIKKSGVINIPLRKKLFGKNEKIYPDHAEGKEAITEFELVKNFEDYALVNLFPLTGRTHQLRVHCKEIGHGIVNDVKYGGLDVIKKNLSDRLCLHAYKIKIPNYFGRELSIETPLPDFLSNKKFHS